MELMELENVNEIKNSAEFLSPKQLEAEFGISLMQQTNLRGNPNYTKKPNPLPYYKLACVGIRYRRSEIVEWIERQKVIRHA